MAVIKSKWNWAIQYITHLFVGTWCAWVKNTCLKIFRNTYLVNFCGSSSHEYRKKLKILHRKEDIQGMWEARCWWDWSTKFLSLFRVIDFPQYKRSSIFVIELPFNIKCISTQWFPSMSLFLNDLLIIKGHFLVFIRITITNCRYNLKMYPSA